MDKTQVILQILEKHGLGITLALILVALFYFVLKHLIKSYNDIISRQNDVLDNHLNHLNNSVSENSSKMNVVAEKFENGVEKICSSIQGQTDLMRTMIQNRRDSNG